MTRSLRLGISTCPNDTYAFAGLLAGEVALEGAALDIALDDVEALNRRLAAGRFDAAKASFHAALHLARDVRVLRAGSALGFGVGPVLLRAPGRGAPSEPVATRSGAPRRARVLCPGERTTATLLYELLHRGEGEVAQVVFSEIFPALQAGEADFGVCIHEGRFTWRAAGLELLEDLGATWEARTGAPVPLGGILVRKSLEDELAAALDDAIVRSLDWAAAHRDRALATMREHAQEQADEALWQHVELYVNAWTRDLGAEGARALAALDAAARRAGLLAADAPPLEVRGA